jgi:uncharacterized lipoprotein NlpE involved in copper resistance
MKKIKYLFVMFVAVMVSVSCNNDDDDNFDGGNGDNALVGIWGLIELEEGVAISVTATFNENLSGTLVTSETFEGETASEFESFTWSTDGNKLRLIFDEETEILTYSISGDTLTVTDDEGFITVLTKQ